MLLNLLKTEGGVLLSLPLETTQGKNKKCEHDLHPVSDHWQLQTGYPRCHTRHAFTMERNELITEVVLFSAVIHRLIKSTIPLRNRVYSTHVIMNYLIKTYEMH